MRLVCSVPVHTMKAYERGGGITPHIPNHGGLLKVKEPPVPFNRWLDGRQSRPGRCAEEKYESFDQNIRYQDQHFKLRPQNVKQNF
jgi:hypothetical protein